MTAPSPPLDRIERDRAGRRWFVAVLAAGIALRAWQWLSSPPLWLDELALANGLLSGPFGGLFDGPSDFAQVAPPGFLAMEWLLHHVAPASELVLRAPSFLLSSAAIATTWLASRELVGERNAWIAPGLVAVAGPLIFMSGQVKPYAADVFFTSLIVAGALRHARAPARVSLLALLAAGIIAPLFSFGSIFVLAGAGVYLLLSSAREWRRQCPALAAVIVSWTLVAVASVLLSRSLLSPIAAEFMADYWSDAFPAIPPRTVADATWPVRSILTVMWSLMGLREVSVFGVALVASLVVAWKQRPAIAMLLLTPLVAAATAAALRQFPFAARVLHWTVPLLAIMLTLTAASLSGWLRRRARLLSPLPALATLATPLLTLAMLPPPYKRDDVRPALERLSASGRPGDALYVYWGAWHSWQRYGRDVAAAVSEVHQGGCPIDYPRGYLRDLDQFRGRPRVWLILGRVEDERAPAVVLGYLDAIGVRADSVLVVERGLNVSPRVALYRYDLSDSARLAAASAETFPVPAELTRIAQGCPRIDAMFRRADGKRVVQLF